MIHDVVKSLRKIREAEPDRKWLIVGKGPTADLLHKVDTSRFFTVTLNHACRLLNADLCHFTDLEALDDCEQTLCSYDSSVCVPWHPHIGMKPSPFTLMNYARPTMCSHRAILSWSMAKDKLFSYNSTVSAKLKANAKLSTVRVKYFSAVAVLNILADAGVKLVHTIGVDGGTRYAKAFDDLTPLKNGRESFDVQATEFDRTCSATGCRLINVGGLLCES